MKNFRGVGITLLALSMGMGGLASAQVRGSHDNNDHRSDWRGPGAVSDHTLAARDVRHQRDNRDVHGNAYANPYYGVRGEAHDQRGDQQGDWHGAGLRYHLRSGSPLSRPYRGPQYVVNDWRGRHLSEPPRGYQWVEAGGGYVLAAIATGVILQMLLND